MKVSEWLKHEGIAMTAQEQVVTSTPILINHDGKVYAGWKWSDGIENFAHNTAGNAFTLEQDEYSVCGWLHDSNDPHPVPYRSENVGNDSKPQEVTTPSLIEMAEEIERLTQGRIPFERA